MARLRSPLPVFLVTACTCGTLALPAPGWRDAGELGAAAATLGVPHPTGFPLEMLWLHLASYLPLGPLGFRQNALTALAAAGALAVLAALLEALLRRAGSPERFAAAGGGVAAAALGAWPGFVRATLAVEVYVTALLLGGLALLQVAGRPGARLGLLGGLSASSHLIARWPPLLRGLGQLARAGSPAARWRRLLAVTVGGLLGLLLVLYLPAVSLRDPPLDWGDPDSPARLLAHLTAARIRAGFEGQMGDTGTARSALGTLLGQLGALGPMLLLALAGGLRLARASAPVARRGVLLALALLAIDLGYGAWVNPMGVGDWQVGFLAAAALAALAGAAVAPLTGPGEAACDGEAAGTPRRPGWSRLVPPPWMTALLAFGWFLHGVWSAGWRDGHAAEELHGGGGSLLRVPSRAVLLCEEDDACAQLWFARYAVGQRPDVTVVPLQHLWDPHVRRLLPAALRPADEATFPEPPGTGPGRRALAERIARRWLTNLPVPVLVQTEHLPARALPLRPSVSPPWRAARPEQAAPPGGALARLLAAYRARVPQASQPRDVRVSPFVDPMARAAWSRAFEQVGRGALDAHDLTAAVAAMRAATEAAPERAVAWVDLGVALARAGRLGEAIEATRQALRRDPQRPVAWRNLVRFLQAAGREDEARAVLKEARRLGLVRAPSRR